MNLRIHHLITLGLVSLGIACSDDPAPAGEVDSGTLAPDSGAKDSGSVDAAPATFPITVNISGLTGSGLVLQNNGRDDLTVAPGATTATFATKVAAGGAFAVTVKTQPGSPPQRCTVSGGSGTVANGPVSSVTVMCANAFTIGGTTSGLSGRGLVLVNKAGNDLTVNANGSFAFSAPAVAGDMYDVTVKTQPTMPSQTCTVTKGKGTVASANITDIEVACTTNTYNVSGTISGLSGMGAVIRNNGADDLALVNGATTFTFATKVASGMPYAVTVSTQPTGPSQTCTVTAGSGNVLDRDVTNVAIACVTNKYKVGGNLAGMTGMGLVLQNNGADDLTLNANGAFNFATTINSGATYNVTIKTQPAGQTCRLIGARGTVEAADVTTVVARCGTIANPQGTQVFNGTTPGVAGNYHNSVTSDPVTGKVYAFANYSSSTLATEWADVTAFRNNTNPRTITLATPRDGTYVAVLNGSMYYAAANAASIVKASAATGAQEATQAIAGAGFRNQSYFNWGGYSDINLYVDDGNKLYVLSAPPGGNMELRAVNPATLSLGAPVSFGRVKTNTGWAFIVGGLLYFGNSYNNPAFGGAFDIVTGNAVTIPAMSFTSEASEYITSISRDPASSNLFVHTNGKTYIYPNVR
jgi:hypothetical protein